MKKLIGIPGFILGGCLCVLKNEKSQEEPYTPKLIRVKKIDKDGNDLVKIIRNNWIDEASRSKQKSFNVKIISDVISNNDVIEKALSAENCNEIEIVIGPAVDDNNYLSLVNKFSKPQYKNKVRIFRLNQRPDYHAISIGGKSIYEDPHEPSTPAEWVTILPEPNKRYEKKFNDYIYELKRVSQKRQRMFPQNRVRMQYQKRRMPHQTQHKIYSQKIGHDYLEME